MAVVRRTSDDLAYQGTHILTHGAFRSLAARYQRDAAQRFVVYGGGCDDGITSVNAGGVDLGGLCCPVERTRAEGLPWVQVAWDIKVVIAHASQPVDDIPLDTLRDVVSGRAARWSAVSGDDRPIALVYRDHCPEYIEPVRDLLLDNRQDWSPRALAVDTDEMLVDTVARFQGALGVVSWVFARDRVVAGELKVLAVDGVAPDPTAVAAGRYPLVGPLNLVFKHWHARRMAGFFEYLYSPAGQAVMSELLVPVPPDTAGDPPRELLSRFI